jgi:hypothetical protein
MDLAHCSEEKVKLRVVFDLRNDVLNFFSDCLGGK